jgi:hypothetical protein
MRPARLGATYLFSGRAKAGAKGQIEPEPDSLSPVRDVILFVDDPGKPGAVLPWKTDAKGLLYPVADSGKPRPTAVHYRGKKRRVYLPPPDALLKAWAKNRESWAEGLKKGLASKAGSYPATELSEIDVAKSSLRPPDRQSDDDAEKDWARFYDGLPAKGTVSAWVLPTTRALVLQFSGSAKGIKTVEITPDGRGPIKCDVRSDAELAFAVATGDEKSLPAGLYSFTVLLDGQAAADWSAPVARARKYQLKEQVRFGITNFAGEFDVVNCDPISIEESVMQQFPALYWHRIAAAKQRSDYPELSTDPEYKEFPKALEQWSERLEWTQAKAKLTVGLINADGCNKRAQLIGKAVWKQFKPFPDNEYVSAVRNSIDLAFQVRGQIKEWKEILEGLEAERELAGLKRLLWQDLKGHFERYRWWEFAKQEFLDGDKEWRVLELASATSAERKVILKAGIPEKRTALQELVGKSAGKAIEKGLIAAQLAIDVYNAALAFNDVLDARKDEKDLVADLGDLLEQVDAKIARSACREAIGNLERLRAATVLADRKVEDAEAKALMSAIDVVLGVLSLVFPPLAIVVAVKETVSLAKDVAIDAGEWLDRLLLKGVLADLFARHWTQMAELARNSSSNQSLMPHVGADGGADDLNVQLRLRAEALHGLIALLTRASVASKNEKEYLERVEKYRVAEYIRHYLLDDGWQFPVRPMLPISMDAAWLYLTGPYGAYATEAAVSEQLGFAHPLKAAALGTLPGGMTMLVAVDSVLAGNAIAKYQKTFPIHRADESVPELAKAFRTAWKELDTDAIEYTCVYWRPAGSTGKEGWKPVNANGVRSVDQLELRSPLDQIRILVVLKSSASHPWYPLSFQVHRTDGVNIPGPVYRELTRRLEKDKDLLPHEDKFKDRIGCVFYPFFELGKQMIPGIKPLARAAGFFGAGGYKFFGYLDDMRYGFKLKVGDASFDEFLTIGGPDGAASDLDEVRVGITGKVNEDSLLVAGFLDSHSKEFVYPLLFQMTHGFGPCYVRVGGGDYRLATPDESATLTFDTFTWKESVEFVVVAYSLSIAYADWDRMKLDWSRVPMEMELVNFHGLGSDDGPTYSSELNYVGQLSTGTASIFPVAAKPDDAVGEWLSQIRKSPDAMRKLIDGVDPRNFGSMATKASEYHLFAAHFALDYFLPGGDQVKSLRPFGRTLTGSSQHYRIGIRNLRTPQDCNLQQTKMEASVSTVFMHEYEFRFRAPASHTSGVPWASLPEGRRKKWIEEENKKRNPNVELVAK